MCFFILDLRRLGFRIEMGRNSPDHLDRAHPVRDRHHRIAINSLALCPKPPFAVDRARGVHQHSIQIEKNG